MLPGCAGGLGRGDPNLGTAVIGLRIQDTPALQEARAGHRWSTPIFGLLNRPPRAGIRFARVDPSTGGVDLPFLVGLSDEYAWVRGEGFATAFDAVQLVAGRYVTMQAELIDTPSSRYAPIRVLTFSGSDRRSADPDELDGYEFDVAAGATVYVGTMVLSLVRGGRHGFTFAPPRIEDEFAAASSAYPALAAVGRARGTRLMTRYGLGMPAPRVVPAAPPPSIRQPTPAPRDPLPSGPANVPRVG